MWILLWNVPQRIKLPHEMSPGGPTPHPTRLPPTITAHLFQPNSCIDQLIHNGLRELSVSQQEGSKNFIILQYVIYLQAAALTE